MRLRAGATSILPARPADDDEKDLARSHASGSAYLCHDMRSWAVTKVLVVLVPGLTDDGDDVYEVGARSIFPEARPGRRANWLPSGPRLLPIPRMGCHGIASLELGGRRAAPVWASRLWHSSLLASPEAVRPSTVEREGPPKREGRCM
jgi:hypothetical protein